MVHSNIYDPRRPSPCLKQQERNNGIFGGGGAGGQKYFVCHIQCIWEGRDFSPMGLGRFVKHFAHHVKMYQSPDPLIIDLSLKSWDLQQTVIGSAGQGVMRAISVPPKTMCKLKL